MSYTLLIHDHHPRLNRRDRYAAMRSDPFKQFRQSVAGSYTATTGADGLTLTLTAVDVVAFHIVAVDAIEIANRFGWRVPRLVRSHPGGNISEVIVAPPH